MQDFVLPINGNAAHLSVLGETDLNDVLSLQNAARDALPADKKHFILPRDIPYFQNLLAHATGRMAGVRTNGKLVAQVAMMGPLTLREALAMHAITYNDIAFHHAALTDIVIVFKSLASHPEWRGNNLANNLISFALELPFTQACHHVFAQISVGNKRSWDVFSRQGFGIVAAAYDPADGHPRFIFQKPAFGFDFADETSADDVDPSSDFPAIISLTQREALIGIYEEGSTEKLRFMRNREALNLMPVIAKVS